MSVGIQKNKLAKFIATFIAVFFIFASSVQVLAADSSSGSGSASDTPAEGPTPDPSTEEAYKKCLRDTYNQQKETVCAEASTKAKTCANTVFQDPTINRCVTLANFDAWGSFSLGRKASISDTTCDGAMIKAEGGIKNCQSPADQECNTIIAGICEKEKNKNPLSDVEPVEPAPATPTTPSPSQTQFDVSKYLKIEGGQTYLDTEAKQKGAVGEFIIKLIKLLTTTIGSLALLVIIIGGMTLMLSHGNQNLQTKGKEMIKFAILGLIIAFMSLIIVTFVESLFYTV